MNEYEPNGVDMNTVIILVLMLFFLGVLAFAVLENKIDHLDQRVSAIETKSK